MSIPSLPITATASGSLKPVLLSTSLLTAIDLLTRQIEEVGVLVELVKYCARPVLDFRGSQNGDGILGELCSKL